MKTFPPSALRGTSRASSIPLLIPSNSSTVSACGSTFGCLTTIRFFGAAVTVSDKPNARHAEHNQALFQGDSLRISKFPFGRETNRTAVQSPSRRLRGGPEPLADQSAVVLKFIPHRRGLATKSCKTARIHAPNPTCSSRHRLRPGRLLEKVCGATDVHRPRFP